MPILPEKPMDPDKLQKCSIAYLVLENAYILFYFSFLYIYQLLEHKFEYFFLSCLRGGRAPLRPPQEMSYSKQKVRNRFATDP